MFKLIALRPLIGCKDSILKCLKVGQMYYFCNDYVITDRGIGLRDEYVRPLPDDFFSLDDNSEIQINISAVVGMNGDGKSSIVEMIMRLINNCAKHYNLTDKDQLLRIEGVKAEFYYEVDNIVYCIRETSDGKYASLLKYADMSVRNVRQWKKLMTPVAGVKNLKELFFTLVSNYSHYAYNTKDFRDEWAVNLKLDEESKKCWLYYLFHKNDGYLTPMTIHPYRYEGNIDVNREVELAMQRLLSLYIQEQNPKENDNSFRRLGGKDANVLMLSDAGNSNLQEKTIVQYFIDSKTFSALSETVSAIEDNIKNPDDVIFERLHNYKLKSIEASLDYLTGVGDKVYRKYLEDCLAWISKRRGRIYSSNSDVRQLLNALKKFENNVEKKLHHMEFARKYKRFDKLNVSQLVRLRFVYCVMQRWMFDNDILLKDYTKLTDIEKCQHYIVYKTIDICGTYPKYRNLMDGADSGWNNHGLVNRDSIVIDVVEMIKKDDSHITLKLRQCLNYIARRRTEKNNIYEKLNDKKLPQKVREKYQGCMFVKFDAMKAHYKADPFPLQLLPPPIYKTDILYQSTQIADEFIPYRYLSSGEKQLLNNIGAIIYHLRNLDSVQDERSRYESVNIFLEEIELYFHPEYQRMIVKLLLEKLHAVSFKHIRNINITFVTHSPFILSDIPLCNVLFLKEGKPSRKKMQENTFGANIHSMLKNGFFLPSLPVGEFAYEKINMLFERLNGFKLDSRDKKQAVWFYSSIMRVGEPYLREQLMKLYNMHFPVD